MKVTEDAQQRLTVSAPRGALGYVFHSAHIGFGLLLLVIPIRIDPGPLVIYMIAGGITFAAIGLYKVWTYTSTRLTLDATSRTATLNWHSLRRSEEISFPLKDIAAVDFHQGQNHRRAAHTVRFSLTDGQWILMEREYHSNPEAEAVATRIRTWLASNGLRER